jgi:8-oxo-dGTP pyrophosphatase MutT (NUDIX family)
MITENRFGDVRIHFESSEQEFPTQARDWISSKKIFLTGLTDATDSRLPESFQLLHRFSSDPGAVWGNALAKDTFFSVEDDHIVGSCVLPILHGSKGTYGVAVKCRGKSYLMPPAGMTCMGETKRAAAVRELKEETGLQADEKKLKELSKWPFSYPFANMKFKAYTSSYGVKLDFPKEWKEDDIKDGFLILPKKQMKGLDQEVEQVYVFELNQLYRDPKLVTLGEWSMMYHHVEAYRLAALVLAPRSFSCIDSYEVVV